MNGRGRRMTYDRDGMKALLRDVRRVVGSDGRVAAARTPAKKTNEQQQYRWFDGVNESEARTP